MPTLTRGPLPAGVYWRRRVMVIGTFVLLVFAFARILGAGSDASSGADEAQQVAADQTSSAPADAPSAPSTETASSPGRQSTSTAPVLAEPDGPCADEDIVVTPRVDDAVAARDVTIDLQVQTIDSEACTWRVSPRTLTLKITSGKDDIWSSRQCPRAIPSRDLVLRRDEPTTVPVTWANAKRSDENCTRRTGWALPGYYHVAVAAMAGEPADEQFELRAPTAPVITRSPTPHQDKPSGRPVASPSSTAD